MKNRNQKLVYIGASLFITIIIHMLLWQVAARIKFESFYGGPAPDPQKMQVNSLNLADPARKDIDTSRQLIAKTDEILDRFLEREFASQEPQSTFDSRSIKSLHQKVEPVLRDTKPILSPSAFPAEILKIDGDMLPKDRLQAKRRRIPKTKRIPREIEIPPVIITDSNATGTYKRNDSNTNIKLGARPRRDVFAKAAPVPMPVVNRLITLPEVVPKIINTAQPARKIESLDSVLDTSVRVYRDDDRGAIFFQIEILPNKSAVSIKPIPKDVLFLVDSSNSIAFEKLREFRKGLRLAIGSLATGDNYNVVAFREQASPLFSSLTPASEFNLQMTDEFIRKLKASGKTDVYASLAPFVKAKRKNHLRPYLIFLISDGNTTAGAKLEDNELIRRVMTDNRSNGSIFAFSAGDESNRFLMDFLSYKNRGFSVHAKRIEKSHQKLTKLIQSLREVLVVDLISNISGTGNPEIFPRNLPHLFRNHPLFVYGRADAGTREIALRVVGRSKDHTTEELVTRLNLDTAEVAGPELAHRWASQKVYHLMGQIIEHGAPELREQMISLAAEFNVELPR